MMFRGIPKESDFFFTTVKWHGEISSINMIVGLASGLTVGQMGTLTTCNAFALLNFILLLNTVSPCTIQTSHSKTF